MNCTVIWSAAGKLNALEEYSLIIDMVGRVKAPIMERWDGKKCKTPGKFCLSLCFHQFNRSWRERKMHKVCYRTICYFYTLLRQFIALYLEYQEC